MTTLLIILVTIAVMAADPIIFVIVLVLNFLLLNKKTILIYGILGGLIAEVISSSLNPGQDFGDKILLRIIAATIQSIIAYYIVKYFKNRKNTKKKNK